jgi:hypothetical protein
MLRRFGSLAAHRTGRFNGMAPIAAFRSQFRIALVCCRPGYMVSGRRVGEPRQSGVDVGRVATRDKIAAPPVAMGLERRQSNGVRRQAGWVDGAVK